MEARCLGSFRAAAGLFMPITRFCFAAPALCVRTVTCAPPARPPCLADGVAASLRATSTTRSAWLLAPGAFNAALLRRRLGGASLGSCSCSTPPVAAGVQDATSCGLSAQPITDGFSGGNSLQAVVIWRAPSSTCFATACAMVRGECIACCGPCHRLLPGGVGMLRSAHCTCIDRWQHVCTSASAQKLVTR
jgi:hypothetical protein